MVRRPSNPQSEPNLRCRELVWSGDANRTRIQLRMKKRKGTALSKNSTMPLDIGIIIPELVKHGGAERLLIECLARWQHLHKITVYATAFNEQLFVESGLTKIATRTISPRYEGENAVLLNATVLPKKWEAEIGRHDIYHAHLWPTHLIDLHPMVWYPHEPLRILHDLKYAQASDDSIGEVQTKLHFYPKETYDSVEGADYSALMQAIEAFDSTGRPDRVVANSLYTANYLQQVYGTEVKDVVYPGVTIEQMLDLPGERDLVLAIGQLWPHKRMRLVIEAIAEVEGLQLYIVGRGPERARLMKLCAQMGIDDRVFFLSGLNNHEVQILLARCLCVAFTPVREPFGIVALEALAAGKPLVAVNEGGYVEVVDEGCAILLPPEPSAFAAAIRELHADPERASRMGRHGRELAAKYSWDRTAQELIAIVEDTHRSWAAAHRPRRLQSGPIFAVHYFSWFREGFGNTHWCDNPATGWVTDVPLRGYYSSLDGNILAAHLDQIESTGLDAVVFNLHVNDGGLDIFQLTSAQRMQAMAADRGSTLQFVVMLCLYTTDLECIRQAISILRDTILKKQNYLEVDGRPVFMLFWTGVFDRNLAVIDGLKTMLAGELRVGSFMRPAGTGSESRRTMGLFDSISQFSPLELSSEAHWQEAWRREYAASAQGSGYHCVTICPGYDDTHLVDPARAGGVRLVDHRDGRTYRETMEFALAQEQPAFVFVTSFNEFHENTHIEPSKRHGTKYLDMTREFIGEAKRHWVVSEDFRNEADQ